VDENGWRVLFGTLLWTGIVLLAVVAIVQVSTNAALEAASGDYIRSVSRAEIGQIARKAAQDAGSDSGATPKDWAEGIQAAVTAVGIIAAGWWASYVFFVSRSNIGVVQVLIEPKGLMTSGESVGAIVSVTIKNVGRTRVGKSVARIRAAPLTEDQLELSMAGAGMMPAAVPSTPAELGTVLFSKHATEVEEAVDALEPGQETSEEVVIRLGDAQVARVEAVFIGLVRPFLATKARTFSSRIYLDMATLEKVEKNDREQNTST